MNIGIKTFSNEDRHTYDEFLYNSSYKDILQSWEWGEVKKKLGWDIVRTGFFEDEKLKGIAQIFKKNLPLGFYLLYIPRGPILDWRDKELVKIFLSQLKKYIKNNFRKKILFLRIEPPIIKNKDTLALLEESGFKKYFKTIQPPSTLLIDLSLSEEELFKRFRRTARNLIYRSEKEGVVVSEFKNSMIDSEKLKSFYNIYKMTGKRFSFPLRPYKQFEILINEMKEKNMIRLYVAKIKGLVLAQGLVLVLKDKAFYIWGGSARHKYYSKFFSYGYMWGMLKSLKKQGVKVFDFWGLGPLDNKKHPWYGFSLFKTAFDGEKFNYLGSFDLVYSNFYYLFKIIDKIITPKYRADN